MTYLPPPSDLTAEQVAAWNQTIDVHNGDEVAFAEWFELKVAGAEAMTAAMAGRDPSCPWCRRTAEGAAS